MRPLNALTKCGFEVGGLVDPCVLPAVHPQVSAQGQGALAWRFADLTSRIAASPASTTRRAFGSFSSNDKYSAL
jgi:hypothetical protein